MNGWDSLRIDMTFLFKCGWIFFLFFFFLCVCTCVRACADEILILKLIWVDGVDGMGLFSKIMYIMTCIQTVGIGTMSVICCTHVKRMLRPPNHWRRWARLICYVI